MIKSTFDIWEKMKILNSEDKESMMLHGQFLTEILNEKNTGQNFIEKARETVSNIKFFNNDISSLTSDGSPCIIASPIEVILIYYILFTKS